MLSSQLHMQITFFHSRWSETLITLMFVLLISSMEDFYPSKNHGPDSGIGSDNGDKRLSTTEVSAQTRNINWRASCFTPYQNEAVRDT